MSRVLVALFLQAVSALFLVDVSVVAEDHNFYEVKDEWIYDVTMEYESITMEGNVTYSVSGLSEVSVAGATYEAYVIAYNSDLSVDGYAGSAAVEGVETITGKAFVEVESLDEIQTETTISTELVFYYDFPTSKETWEYNLSTYSPPGGVGEEPEDVTEGESWTITYATYYDSMYWSSSSESGVQTDSGSGTAAFTYTYLGRSTITVPAGTFDCEVIQCEDGDSITTDWYCKEVGTYVKEVYESGTDETGEMVLISYSYEPNDSSWSSGDGDTLLLIVGAAAAVVVVLVAAALLMLRRRPKAPQVMAGAAAPVPNEPSVEPLRGGPPEGGP